MSEPTTTQQPSEPTTPERPTEPATAQQPSEPTTPQRPSEPATAQRPKKKTSQISDLITMGVFIALFLAVMMVCGMVMGALPPVMVALPVIFGVVGGLIFTVLLGRVQRPGAFLISSVLLGVFLIGMAPGGSMTYMTIAGGALAEAAYSVLGRKSFRSMTIAYSAYMLCFAVGEYIPFVWMKEAYLAQYADAGGSAEVARIGTEFLNPATMAALCAATIVASILGCLWGRRLTRKQFERAGVV